MSDDELRGRARIRTTNGVDYMTLETADEVLAELRNTSPGYYLTLTTVTGQNAFPPESLHILCDQIASVQEMSYEAWVWTQRATELHYARMLNETPAESLAATQARLVEALSGDE